MLFTTIRNALGSLESFPVFPVKVSISRAHPPLHEAHTASATTLMTKICCNGRELACLAMTATEDVMAGNISFSNDFLGSDSS